MSDVSMTQSSGQDKVTRMRDLTIPSDWDDQFEPTPDPRHTDVK